MSMRRSMAAAQVRSGPKSARRASAVAAAGSLSAPMGQVRVARRLRASTRAAREWERASVADSAKKRP